MHILVVEDNKADARLVVNALREHPLHRVSIVEDGEQAMAFVRRLAPYTTVLPTDLILLDLNIPGKDGRVVLAECKADPLLCHIPIIMLTSTEAPEEVTRAYQLGATAYCHKPQDLDDYFSLIHMIAEFWGRWAQLAYR